MYLLYLDESGNENDPSDRYFVLAGLAVFERQTYFLGQRLDAVQEKHFPNHQPIPFHATSIRAGSQFWRKVPVEKREAVLKDVVEAIRSASHVRFYAAAVEKNDAIYGETAVEKATEDICQRFDTFLKRRYQEDNDPQRGLLIFSEGRLDARSKVWVSEFRNKGTSWGTVNNLADIPYFASMKESRLLQAADFIAHAVWLLYEKRDPRLIQRMLPRFDVRDGVMHGLAHVSISKGSQCGCPPCSSRRVPGSVGRWIGPTEQLELTKEGDRPAASSDPPSPAPAPPSQADHR